MIYFLLIIDLWIIWGFKKKFTRFNGTFILISLCLRQKTDDCLDKCSASAFKRGPGNLSSQRLYLHNFTMLSHHTRYHQGSGLSAFLALSFFTSIVTLPYCLFKPGAGLYKKRYYLKNYLLAAHHNCKHLKIRSICNNFEFGLDSTSSILWPGSRATDSSSGISSPLAKYFHKRNMIGHQNFNRHGREIVG